MNIKLSNIKNQLKKINKKIIIIILIIWIIFWFFYNKNNIENNKIIQFEKKLEEVWRNKEVFNILPKWAKLKYIKADWDFSKFSEDDIKKIWIDKLKKSIVFTYLIYDDKKDINNYKSWINEFLLTFDKNSEMWQKLLTNSPFHYNMFPIIILSKEDKNNELFLNKIWDKNYIKKWDLIYISPKYQININKFLLSDKIIKDIKDYCNNIWKIIDNWYENNNLYFIWNKSLIDFFKNSDKLYSINKNICFLPNEFKDIYYLNEPKDINLKLFYKNEKQYINSLSDSKIKDKALIKTLIDYFENKNWVFILKNNELIKIKNLKNLFSENKK